MAQSVKSKKISISSRHSDMPYLTQCLDVANQLSYKLYGAKNYNSILHHHQNVLISKLKGTQIIVKIPSIPSSHKSKKTKTCRAKKNHGQRCECSKCGGLIGQRNGPHHMDDGLTKACISDIKKMVHHGLKKGLIITCS